MYRRAINLIVESSPWLRDEVARQALSRDLEAWHFFVCDRCHRSWRPFDFTPYDILERLAPAELTEAIGLALDGWASLYLLGCGFPLATLCRACARLPDDDLLASSLGARVLERFVPAESL